MRILVGSDDGLRVVRWLEGEKSGTVVHRGFDGDRVVALAQSGDRLLAAVPERGLFRSDDEGATWTPVADRLGGGRVTALATAASGSILAGTEPAAVHVSRDGGTTWAEMESFRALEATEDWSDYGGKAAHVEAIAFDRHDASRLYAGVEIGGAYRSDDAGLSWTGVNEGLFDDVHALAVDPRDGARVFASTGGGFYASSDRGADWRPAAGAIGDRYCLGLLVLSDTPLTPPSESLLLLGAADGPPSTWGKRGKKAGASLWISRDSGHTWTEEAEQGTRDASPLMAFAANPRNKTGVLGGTAAGHLLHGDLEAGRWRQLLYGLGTVRALLVL